MKRIIVFLLLAALLLGGCGTRTPETEAREAQSRSTAAPGTETRDWSEPNAVDDGYSFRHDPAAYYEETGDDSGLSGLIEKTLLPEYVDRWVDGGEVLWTEFHGLSSGGNQSGTYYGWIAFTGMPKTELGWRTADFNGTKCYCRSIFIRELPNGDNTYTMAHGRCPCQRYRRRHWDRRPVFRPRPSDARERGAVRSAARTELRHDGRDGAPFA